MRDAPAEADSLPHPSPDGTSVVERAKAAFLAGVAHHEAGRHAAARDAFLASLALVPGRVSTLSNLGAAWLRLGRADEALAVLDQALAVAPDDRDAGLHRADALLALGETQAALEGIDRTLAAHASFAGGWLRRGEILLRLDRAPEALDAFERATAVAAPGDPARPVAWRHRGGLLREAGRLDEAKAAFAEAREAGGDAEELDFFLASVSAPSPGTTPSAAPSGFVRDLFDGYAADYDRHLLGPLAYRAHRALVEPLPGIVGRTVFGRALDLGCGTGLCGPLLRPFVSHLTGVDLSPRMLAEAAKSGAYDALVDGEAVAVLETVPQGSLDAVLAADVLIYIGDVEPLARAAARALAPGGVLAFTAERLEGGDTEAHRLDPTLRFRHADGLWPGLARRHGFALAAMRPEVLRMEQGRPVAGLVVVFVREVAVTSPG